MNLNQSYYTDMGIALLVNPTIYFGMGYLCSSMVHSDPLLVAQALAISSFANTLLDIFVDQVTGGPESHLKTYYGLIIATNAALGAIQILAFRHFQVIGTTGTVIFAVASYLKVFYHIYHLNKVVQLT